MMGVASRWLGVASEWVVWPYLLIPHDDMMYLYLHVHKNQQQLLHE